RNDWLIAQPNRLGLLSRVLRVPGWSAVRTTRRARTMMASSNRRWPPDRPRATLPARGKFAVMLCGWPTSWPPFGLRLVERPITEYLDYSGRPSRRLARRLQRTTKRGLQFDVGHLNQTMTSCTNQEIRPWEQPLPCLPSSASRPRRATSA